MNNTELSELMYESNVRIGQLIHIGGATVTSDAVSDPLLEFIEDDLHDLGHNPFPIKNFFEGKDDFESWEVGEWLIDNGLLGFLIQFETPTIDPERVCFSDPTNPDESPAYSYSWGSYQTRWVYSDKFKDAVMAGVSWAENLKEEAFKQARAMRGEE